ncbi:V-type ATP synthase subunit E [Archaeoglobus veneficus]|uniref:A-type ATP synthase subunit E n=1 Tax=Archaeoglobus veneficus (strain DSM 11195 / SNP6) TaxID=693661 RepID=F2KP27_ARCVS|nr:V-type ATP synthase subunit E [Archaeoglobus veneficus]AEA46335.1 V-type proton ATPase subunit E [Archaeoglobus veneficus SNP6]
MALEVIIEEIRKKGDEEVRRIKGEAESEAEKIIAEAKEKAEEILKKAKEEAEKEAERLRRQEISGVNLEMKRLLLNKRKEALETVYEIVQDRIKQMDTETKKKLLENLIKKNAVGEMVVYSNKDDEPVVREVISDMADLKYGGNIDCLGGVILESPDGEVRINLTFDELLKQLYEQKMSEVSKILFGE